MTDARPPRRAERWVQRWSTGTAAGPSVAGDLWEEWARIRSRSGPRVADRWYVRQAIALSLRFAFGRLADSVAALPAALAAETRLAARTLRRSPGFTTVAALSLGGGLGLTTAIFTVINGLLFAPLPWPGEERLVDLGLRHPVEVCAGCSAGASWPAFLEWRARAEGLEAVGAMDGRSVLLTGAAGAERVQATGVSAEVAPLLGVEPAVGRLFTEEEHRVGGEAVAVLTRGLWTRRFGAVPVVAGRSIVIDGVPHEVVGVLPDQVRLLGRGELWLPAEPLRAGSPLEELGLWVFGRLEPGADPSAVARGLTSLHAGLAAASAEVDDRWTASVVPMRASLVGEVGDPAFGWILLTAAGCVLLIACLNLAALLHARVTNRGTELRLRSALGAGAARLLSLVLVESCLVALAGAAVGMALTVWARRLLLSAFGWALPPWVVFPLDLRVWAVGLGGAGVAALMCGVAPALWAARRRGRGVLPGGGASDAPAVRRRHRVLLGLQVAVGVALVASTTLSVRSFQRVADFGGLGFRWEAILGVRVVTDPPAAPVPLGGDPGAAGRPAHDEALAALASHRAVTAVAAEARLFLGSWGAADGPSPMHIEGRAEPVPDRIVPRHSLAVSTGYLDLFEIAVLRGRGIEARDRAGAPPVAVVSRTAAELLWPASDPLGSRFTVSNGTVEGAVTVVGVASDVVFNPRSESRRPTPRIYFSLEQAAAPEVVYRAAYSGVPPTRQELAGRLSEVDPTLPIVEVTTVRQELERWITPVTVVAAIMGTLGGLSLLLLALGVVGTVSFQVSSRTREIGIRRALGAGRGRLIRDIGRDVLRVLVAGGAAGAVGAGLAGDALRSGFVQIGTSDPWVLLLSAVVIVLCAASAAYVPLRRALRIDAREALRAD